MIKTLPYLLPLAIPFLALKGVKIGGWFVLSAVAIAYLLHPILDLVFLFLVLMLVTIHSYSPWELAGIILSAGTVTGGMGITVAHELIHRRERWERGLGVLLLSMVNYAHFRVEHVLGHHKLVATPLDPATARKGESLWHFLYRSVTQSWLSAWRIEERRLSKRKEKKALLYHRLVQYILFQSLVAVVVFLFFGGKGLGVYLAQGVVAFLTLEVINYIEHYGLERKEISPGIYEAVTELHSWDSRHRMTNWFLFNLGRHAHHHASPTVTYEKLRPGRTANVLKYGYSTQMLLALLGKNNRAVSSKQ